MPDEETWNADQCAAAWHIAVGTWLCYVATGKAPPHLNILVDNRRQWSPTSVREYPRSGQGRRNDILGRRLGDLATAARIIAAGRDRLPHWHRIHERLLDGNPAAVGEFLIAARAWLRRGKTSDAEAAALTVIDDLELAIGPLGDAELPMTVRTQIYAANPRVVISGTPDP